MASRLRAEPRDLWWFRANVPCLEACPVKTDAGRYVQLVAEGRFAEAYRVARSPNPIASICGRTCGAPCEDACRRGKLDARSRSVWLRRWLADPAATLRAYPDFATWPAEYGNIVMPNQNLSTQEIEALLGYLHAL